MLRIIICIVFLITTNFSFGQNNLFKYLDTTHNKFCDVDEHKIKAIKACPDGKFIAIGSFRTFGARISPFVIRLNNNGSIDTTFHSPFLYDQKTYITGLTDVEVASDGSVFVVGFTGLDFKNVYKLKSNGQIDPSFQLPFPSASGVLNIEIKNEQIILSGTGVYSQQIPPYSVYYVVKLNMNGSLVNTFLPNRVIGDNEYNCLALKDSSILLYGNITSYNTTPTNRIIKISSKGELDNTFYGAPNNQVKKIIEIGNNEFIISGTFTTFNGVPTQGGVVRVDQNGNIINTFDFSAFPTHALTLEMYSINEDSLLLNGGYVNTLSPVTTCSILKTSITGVIDKKYFVNTNNTSSGLGKLAYDSTSKRMMAVGQLFIEPSGEVTKKVISQFYSIDLEGKIYSHIKAENGISSLYFATSVLKLKDSSIVFVGFNDGMYKGFQYNSFCKLDKNLAIIPDTFLTNTFYTFTLQNDYEDNYYLPYPFVNGNYSSTGLGFFVKKYFTDYKQDLNFDANINQTSITNGFMNSFVLQKDGRIVVLMYLNDGTNTFFLERYNSDGTKDVTFHRLQWTAPYASNPRIIKAEEQNCYFVISKNPLTIDGIACPTFFKISNEGYVDRSYRLRLPQYTIDVVFPQGDNLYLSGSFILPNSTITTNTLLKINSTGYIDPSFSLQPQPSRNKYISFSNGRFIMLSSGSSSNDYDTFVLVNPDGSINTDFGKHYTYGTFSYPQILALSDNEFALTTRQVDEYNSLNKPMIFKLPPYKTSYKTIEGIVYKNPTCGNSRGDLQKGIIVKAIPGKYYAITDHNGRYKLNVDTLHNDFTVILMEDSKSQYSQKNTCDTSKAVHFNNQQYHLDNVDFSINSVSCSELTLNISSTNRRRCFKGKTSISVSNNTAFSQNNVEVNTIFPKYIQEKSYSVAYNSKTDSLTTFIIPEIFPYQTVKIEVIDSVMCGIEEIRGLQQCVEAYIHASQKCVVDQPSWDGSYVKLISLPSTNSIFKFKLQNIGDNIMADSAEYRIFFNDTLAVKKKFLLAANAYKEFEVYSDNKTIRVEANQSPGYPLKNINQIFNNPSLATGAYDPSYRISSAIDNERNDYSISCGQILDSFDPNDKNVLPKGQGVDNVITGKEKLTYTIRFQNTGTDTAFTVRIVDTLSYLLDISTFHAGISSHPFQLKVHGTDKSIVTFVFDGINLPDSSKNLLKSQGYINYTIYPEKNIANGTKILNVANIYFDYNSAIKTNTVEQIIDNITPYYEASGLTVIEKFITTDLSRPIDIANNITLYPNPISSGELTLKSETYAMKNLEISDITGRIIFFKEINNYEQSIDLNTLSAGVYIYRIHNVSGEVIYSGKLIKE